MDFKGVLEKIDQLDLMVIPYENATGYGIRAMVNSIEDKDSIKMLNNGWARRRI